MTSIEASLVVLGVGIVCAGLSWILSVVLIRRGVGRLQDQVRTLQKSVRQLEHQQTERRIVSWLEAGIPPGSPPKGYG